MKPPLWTSLALVAGLLLMLVGPAISYLLPTEAMWTNEDAEKLSQASANLHAAIHVSLSHDHEHGQVAAGKPERSHQSIPELAAAQAEYDRQQARLTASVSRRDWLWYGAPILGALIASAGIAGHFLARCG
jgi:beta-glucosidase-like glycosyl hydrolase